MLVLTDQAKAVIKGIVEEAGPDGGLRITAAGDGNGDSALEFDVAPAPAAGDEVVERRRREGLPRRGGSGRAREQDARRRGARRPLSLLARGAEQLEV